MSEKQTRSAFLFASGDFIYPHHKLVLRTKTLMYSLHISKLTNTLYVNISGMSLLQRLMTDSALFYDAIFAVVVTPYLK